MTGIWEFPELDALEAFFLSGVERARQEVISNFEEEDDDRSEVIERFNLERLVVVNDWGNGTAEIGEDILRVLAFFSVEGEEAESLFPQFDSASRTITQQFNVLVNAGEIEPPEEAFEWFPNIDLSPRAIDRFESNVSLALGRGRGNTVYDMTEEEAIQFTEPPEPEIEGGRTPPRPFSELPRIPLQALLEQAQVEEEPEPEPEEEPESEPEPEPEPVTAEDRIRRSLEQFQLENMDLEIPAGKPTRRVEFRDLYDFELRMGLPSNILGELEGFAPGDQLENGVGWEFQLGRVGNQEPPATFPRTSSYIRNRLLFEGPAYILEMYRDLVVYSGFISGFYGMTLKPGTYGSFRNFIHRLVQIGERGGPVLIRPLSQQQAAARGLETLPDHPTIEGEKAPWLERRHYYEIAEESVDRGAWDNPVEFLYETLEQ